MTGLLWVEGVGTALVSGAELVAADAAGAGLGVVVQDSSGVIVAANDVGGELLGLSWDQLVGRTSRDSRWSAVSVQGVALTGDQHPAMRTLATGEPVDDFLMGVLIPAGSDAGRIQWLSISAYPVGTPVVGVVTVFTDVSDPSLAQGPDRMLAAVQGVAAAEQRFASMFYTNAAMMMLIDPDNGQIVDANQAAADFYGYPAEQLRSMLISEINMLPDEQVARLRAQVVAGERTSAVFPHRLASGQIRSVLAQSSPIVHHGRTVLFSIGRDVTEREQVEIQLRQATAVFDNTLEAVIITGAAGIVQQVNRAFTTITGRDSTQVIGLSAQSLGGPATTTETRDRIRSAIQDGTAFSGEFSVRHADATQSPVLISISPIPSRMGEVTGFVWVMTDITDRVRAEQELADTAQQYKMLAENVTDVVLFASPQWKLVWASASARDVLGYDPTAMVGADVTNLIHPDDVPLLMSARVAVDEGKESKVTYELRARTATGDYRWLSVVSGPALDANGVNIGRISALRDIHDQVLARQALAVTASELADSERRYRWLAENASDVVFHIDADSLIRWASPSVARVLGWTPEQLVGRAVNELDHRADRDRVQQWRAAITVDTPPPAIEIRVRTGKGSYLWMSIVAQTTTAADGSIDGRVVGLRDVQQQVEAREQLARSERMFRLAIDGAPAGTAVVDLSGHFLQVNEVLGQLVGHDQAWMEEHTESELIHPDDRQADVAARDRLLAAEAEFDIHEGRLVTATGAVVWVQHSVALVRDEHDGPLFYVSQYQDITAARAAKAELTYLARHDPLTGLINRGQLQERIGTLLGRGTQSGGQPAILFCDLDYFKHINDTYGHAGGDEVLRVTAERMAAVLREGDEVARIGGDEFVVLLGEVRDLTVATLVAEKVRHAVSEPLPVEGERVIITMSIGIALATPGIEAHRLLRNADAALYEAKNSGRNQIAVFNQPS